MFRFSTQVLACSCGLWFQCQCMVKALVMLFQSAWFFRFYRRDLSSKLLNGWRDMVMFLLTGASGYLISLDREESVRPMESKKFLLLECFLWMGPPAISVVGGGEFHALRDKEDPRPSHLFWLSLSCPFCPYAPVFLSSKRGVQMPSWARPLVVYMLMLPIPLNSNISRWKRGDPDHSSLEISHEPSFLVVHSSPDVDRGTLLDTEEE